MTNQTKVFSLFLFGNTTPNWGEKLNKDNYGIGGTLIARDFLLIQNSVIYYNVLESVEVVTDENFRINIYDSDYIDQAKSTNY